MDTRIIGDLKAFDLHEVSVRAGRHVLVEHATLEAHPGEIVGVLGAANAGKSYLLRLLAGQLRPRSGRGAVLGEDIFTPGLAIRRRVLYVPPEGLPLARWSLRAHLEVLAHAYDRPPAELRQDLLDRHPTSIPLGRPCRAFSPSERIHVALTLAEILKVDILLLDAPLRRLSSVDAEELWLRLASRGDRTVVLATRNLSEAFRFDRVVVMSRRETLICDAPDRLREYVADVRFHQILVPPTEEMVAFLREDPDVLSLLLLSKAIRVARRKDARPIADLLAALGLDRARQVSVTPRVDEIVRLLLFRRQGGIR